MTYPYRKLTLAFGLVFALPYADPSLAAASPSAALFDKYMAAGLPQAFALPRSVDDERGQGVDDVIVEERLDTDVVYPDGSHATTYVGTANGEEATFTRIGDALSVSVFSETPPLAAASLHAHGDALPGVDDVVAPPAAALHAPASPSLSNASPARELQFWIFLHDKSGESNYAKFHSWYLGWWVRDMERTVNPGVPIKVFIVDRVPGVTDFDYHQGTRGEALIGFRAAADNHLNRNGNMPSALRKTMLFVNEPAANWEGVYGLALQSDTVAFATGAGPRHGVAHEFGHTLNALHEYGETRFLCVTNMRPYIFGLHSCRIYSGRNDAQIRSYVQEVLRRFDE